MVTTTMAQRRLITAEMLPMDVYCRRVLHSRISASASLPAASWLRRCALASILRLPMLTEISIASVESMSAHVNYVIRPSAAEHEVITVSVRITHHQEH